MRIIIPASICLIALAGWLVFERWSGTSLSGQTATVPTRRIVVANVGQFSIFNLIARDKGFFKENGLDAVVDEYDSGATSIRALLSGKADVAIAADFVGVRNIFTTKDLRMLAVVSTHDVFRIVARRDKGIGSPEDLKGKRVGLTRKTASEYYLGRFLTANAMKLGDVTMVDMTPDEQVAGIEDGSVDAVLCYEPFAYDIEEKLGGGVVTWSAQADQAAMGIAYATAPYIARHAEAVERYLRALAEAERYVQEHDAEVRAYVAKTLGYDDAYMRYIWPKFEFGLKLDQGLILTMEEQAHWTIDNGLTDAKNVPNYLDYVYFDGLAAAKPGSVTIVH